MSNRTKLISLAPRKPRPAAEPPMPTLKEYWEALQKGKKESGSASAASSGLPYGSGSVCGPGSGWRYGSGSGSGSGDGVAGYGVGLVAPADRFSRERILTIMRDLCEKESKNTT